MNTLANITMSIAAFVAWFATCRLLELRRRIRALDWLRDENARKGPYTERRAGFVEGGLQMFYRMAGRREHEARERTERRAHVSPPEDLGEAGGMDRRRDDSDPRSPSVPERTE